MKRLVGTTPSDNATVSVVCAVRNAGHCFEELLNSYRRERTGETELIVLDAESTDASWEILQSHQDLVSIALSRPDAGIYDAWNQALPLCKGRYVAFIGADDRIAGGALETLVEACNEDAGQSHIISGFSVSTRGGFPVALIGGAFDRKRLVSRLTIAHALCAHRLDWLISSGGFRSSLRSAADYELLIRNRKELRVRVIPSVLAYVEDGGISRSSLLPYLEDYRARRMNGIPFAVCVMLLGKGLTHGVLRRLGYR